MAPIFKSSLVVLLAAAGLLPSLSLAAPLNNLQKRKIVWETVTDVVWTTVDVTTTVYDPNYTGPPAAKSMADGGQFFDRPSKPTQQVENNPPSPTTTAAPTTTEAPPPPATTTSVAPPPPPPPAPTTSTTTQAPAPTTPAQEPSPAATTSSSPAPAEPQAQVASPGSGSGSSGGSSSSPNGQCTESSPCTGDITFYTAGLGACGVTSNGATDDVIALPVGMMGPQSNGNPFCGLKVTIKNGDKTAHGTVLDKCMGCANDAIDLSNHLFDQLGAESAGRIPGVEWFFD